MTQESSSQDGEPTSTEGTPPEVWSRRAPNSQEELPSETPPEAESPAAESGAGNAAAGEVAGEPVAAATTEAPLEEGAVASETPLEPVPQASQRPGLPPWLPFLLLAVVPAVIVGVLVFALAGGGGGGSSKNAAGIVDGLIRLGAQDASTVSSYSGKMPPDFPGEFPVYSGASVVVSVSSPSDQGTNYFVVLSSADPLSKIYDYYNGVLDKDPWQVEIGRSSEGFTGLRFSRPDNADVSGDITLHRSDLDNRTEIYLSYTDTSKAISSGGTTTPFALAPSRPLPAGFPSDIPIFKGNGDTTIVDTYFERAQGGQSFIVSFLTKSSADDVITYYRKEFSGRGWTVNDSSSLSNNFAVGIDFDDGSAKTISGSVTANSFESDSSFTKVDLVVQASTSHRGN